LKEIKPSFSRQRIAVDQVIEDLAETQKDSLSELRTLIEGDTDGY
jgi:hypothetical protein